LVVAYDDNSNAHSINQLWNRRQNTKSNGVAYIIQRGAEAVFTKQEKFLKESGVFLNYDEEELEEDVQTIKALRGIE